MIENVPVPGVLHSRENFNVVNDEFVTYAQFGDRMFAVNSSTAAFEEDLRLSLKNEDQLDNALPTPITFKFQNERVLYFPRLAGTNLTYDDGTETLACCFYPKAIHAAALELFDEDPNFQEIPAVLSFMYDYIWRHERTHLAQLLMPGEKQKEFDEAQRYMRYKLQMRVVHYATKIVNNANKYAQPVLISMLHGIIPSYISDTAQTYSAVSLIGAFAGFNWADSFFTQRFQESYLKGSVLEREAFEMEEKREYGKSPFQIVEIEAPAWTANTPILDFTRIIQAI